MKNELTFVLCVTSACLANCRSSSVSSQEVFYSASQVHALISKGVARPHGAVFQNRCLGCRTFLWRRPDQGHVFFFTRDGESFGEYRAETLSDGRFLRIEEMYLTSSAWHKGISNDDEILPFVHKVTIPHWDGDVWMGSTIQWALLSRREDGTVAEYLKQGIQETSNASVTIVIPDDLMDDAKEYYLAVYKTNLTEFDKAFFRDVDEEKGLPCKWGWGKIVNGQRELQLEWPTDRPEFLFELLERIPNPPLDASPSTVRTKRVGSMRRSSTTAQGETIDFVPSQGDQKDTLGKE